MQDHPERLPPYCGRITVLATTNSPYARAFENGKAIALCERVHPSLSTLWPQLRTII